MQTQYQNTGKGCKRILSQGKSHHNSWKLRKVVAIDKTGKLIPSKKFLSLKTRGSEKLSYSKSSCSKLISFNQPITYSMFVVSLWAITITQLIQHWNLVLILIFYISFPKAEMFCIFRQVFQLNAVLR